MNDELKPEQTNSEQVMPSLDYSEDHNVNQIHESILREKEEPQEGQEPMSLWVIAFIGALLLWGGYYLGTYSGGFSGEVYDERAGRVAGAGGSGGAAAAAEELDPMAQLLRTGRRTFTANCAACHQATGLGVSGQYPTLVGSSRVIGPERKLIALTLHGYNGSVYPSAMPAQQVALSDAQLSSVLTYIRQEWGNQAEAVSEEDVAAVRAEFSGRTREWSTEELDQLQ